jgi:hypothetical protein
VADWADYQGFDFVYWNMLHDAPQWSIATLPDQAKSAITAYLNNCYPPERFREEFARICNFMNNGVSTDGAALRHSIADLDRKRNQDFAAVCPEMSALINYAKT